MYDGHQSKWGIQNGKEHICKMNHFHTLVF